MSKKSILEKLEEQRKKIEARIQAQRSRLKLRERKEDTRRKILIGAYMLDKVSRDEAGYTRLVAEMDPFLVRRLDRELFGLEVGNDK